MFPHETHIKFDQIKLDALEHVQGRIPAAEVIHPHGKAELLKAFHLGLHEIEIAADHAFSDLDGDFIMADSRGVHALLDFLHNIAGVKIGTGKVNGVRNDEQTVGGHAVDFEQHLFKDIQIQLIDQPRIL